MSAEAQAMTDAVAQALIEIEHAAAALYGVNLADVTHSNATKADRYAQQQADLWTAEAMSRLSAEARRWATHFARSATIRRGASMSDAAAALGISRQAATNRLKAQA